MKNTIARFGKFLSAMVMPNIGAFIAWGFITALFIDTGWIPNANLASIQPFMLTYLLPVLIAAQGGKMVGGDRGRVRHRGDGLHRRRGRHRRPAHAHGRHDYGPVGRPCHQKV